MTDRIQVLVSKSTYDLVRDRVHSRFVGSYTFKGKQHEVDVYEILSIIS